MKAKLPNRSTTCLWLAVVSYILAATAFVAAGLAWAFPYDVPGYVAPGAVAAAALGAITSIVSACLAPRRRT